MIISIICIFVPMHTRAYFLRTQPWRRPTAHTPSGWSDTSSIHTHMHTHTGQGTRGLVTSNTRCTCGKQQEDMCAREYYTDTQHARAYFLIPYIFLDYKYIRRDIPGKCFEYRTDTQHTHINPTPIYLMIALMWPSRVSKTICDFTAWATRTLVHK